jgi:hypothetical protein
MAATAILNGSTIHITLGGRDGAYVAIEFLHGGAPTGKRVELVPVGNSSNLTAWTNGLQGAASDVVLPNGARQFVKYNAAGGDGQDVFVKVLHADNVTVPAANYVPFPNLPGAPPLALIDSYDPDPAAGRKVQALRWTFIHLNGVDQVIVTIIMLDNEGGGGGGVFSLRLEGEGQTFHGRAELVEATR